MENKQLAENIKKECTIKGITLNKMYEDLNIPKSFISDLKTKDRTPSIKRIEEIAEYLEVSIDYLIGREKYNGNTYIANQGNVKGNNTQNIVNENKKEEKINEAIIELLKDLELEDKADIIKEIAQKKKK